MDNIKEENLPAPVNDNDQPMPFKDLPMGNNLVPPGDQQIQRKRLTKILNIKKIKECLN